MIKGDYLALGALIASGFAVLYSYKASKKAVNNLAKKMDTATNSLSKNIDIDISQVIVKEAVGKAMNKAVASEVDSSITQIKDEVDRKISKEVKDAIDKAYADVKEGVKEKLEDEVGDIDISNLKNEVAEKAAKIASKKFENELQAIIKDHDNKLKNISDAYLNQLLDQIKRTRQSEKFSSYRVEPFNLDWLLFSDR